MNFFKNLKTSQKITTLFSLFNFISLLILLVSINIIYFFIWYSDQKQESLYDMNINYQNIVGVGESNIEAFKEYILQKDTIIIPHDGDELVCSKGVAKKLHNDKEVLAEVKDAWFYRDAGKIYFIFSREYDDIGNVKILFDTTPYIKSQIIIIKISFILIIFFTLIYILGGKIISNLALKKLKNIAQFAGELDLDKKLKKIKISGPNNDEIKIVAEALNKTFSKIKVQSKNQKQFITDVSHEFKTPLMVINSKIDLYNKKCEKGVCGDSDIEELLLGIKSNTKKLNKLLETLFLISRFGDGILIFKREEADLTTIVQTISRDLTCVNSKEITFDLKLNEGIKKEIELSTFTILFENLLTNAIKFSNPGGIIEIGLTEKKLWVKDSGIGIEKDEIEKIFQKFYRQDDGVEGFGVGLFIVRRVLDLYNWDIEVKSKKGRGCNFIIKF